MCGLGRLHLLGLDFQEKELSAQNGKLLTLKRENEQLTLRLKKTGWVGVRGRGVYWGVW